jgi:hypothetical protein
VDDVQNNLRVQKSSLSGESATKSGESGSDNNQGMKQNKH